MAAPLGIRSGWEYAVGFDAGSEDVFLGALPMNHSYACGACLIESLLLLGTKVLMDNFETERAFEIIEREKVTLFPVALTQFIVVLTHKERKNYDLSSIRAALTAGYIPPEGLITSVENKMGIYLTPFWRASEVGPGLAIRCPYPLPLELREKYIGHPIADTKVRIVDPTTREEVPDGQIGVLTLYGWHVMKVYWNNAQETESQIVRGVKINKFGAGGAPRNGGAGPEA